MEHSEIEQFVQVRRYLSFDDAEEASKELRKALRIKPAKPVPESDGKRRARKTVQAALKRAGMTSNPKMIRRALRVIKAIENGSECPAMTPQVASIVDVYQRQGA